MKAQISLHIYMGSVPCRPHIKGECCQEERKNKTKKRRMVHWDTEADSEEIMKSREEIKRSRNQGGKNERSTEQRKDLERKGNGIMR